MTVQQTLAKIKKQQDEAARKLKERTSVLSDKDKKAIGHS